MHLTILSLVLSTLISFAASSAIPTHDLALRSDPDETYGHDARDLATDASPSPNRLSARMDQLDPGIVLPGRGWSLVVDKFVPIVGAVVSTVPQAQTELRNLYEHSLSTLQAYISGSTINKPFVLFEGQLLSFMVKQVSGDEYMTADMIRSFCSYMLVELIQWGAFRGIYTLYLRERGGPGMFQVKLQSNPAWVAQGVPGLPGVIGLAALGF